MLILNDAFFISVFRWNKKRRLLLSGSMTYRDSVVVVIVVVIVILVILVVVVQWYHHHDIRMILFFFFGWFWAAQKISGNLPRIMEKRIVDEDILFFLVNLFQYMWP